MLIHTTAYAHILLSYNLPKQAQLKQFPETTRPPKSNSKETIINRK
jgi:hypothetical protein